MSGLVLLLHTLGNLNMTTWRYNISPSFIPALVPMIWFRGTWSNIAWRVCGMRTAACWDGCSKILHEAILVHANNRLFVWLLDHNLYQLTEPEKWGPKQSNRCRLFLNPSDLKTGLNLQNTRVFGCLVLISWLFACLLTEYGCRDNNSHIIFTVSRLLMPRMGLR